ncbi:PEST proteolytic signal-containing nuclear protein-like isoform X3 [Grammomys surdaster]|uniref:PEST proteolytic signal-containing nuclear protein-like isoform X3 n=1 Tax=Grammomys surdaster TaxID=491861 RepID=UPI00109F9A6B|nr:PEST proteolytic signal-containing nuclear protein-like isoform X3 [Grammomys surdaster]
MADGKVGEEKPEKPQGAGAALGPEEGAEKPVKTKTVSSSNGGESSSRSTEKRSAEDKAADIPTKPRKMSKFGFAIGTAGFNGDEDSEPEEMPPEPKMSMKNIGRDTPTSAGPNSFNKGKHGFSDSQKLWEQNIKSHLGNVHDQDN